MVAAAVMWAAVAAGRLAGWWALALPVAAVALSSRRRAAAMVVLVVAGVAAGTLSTGREVATRAAPVPAGTVEVAGRLGDDPRSGVGGLSAPLQPTHLRTAGGWRSWNGPRLAVHGDLGDIAAGERVRVQGRLVPGGGQLRGEPVAGRLLAGTVTRLAAAADPLFRFGNLLRARVERGLARSTDDPAAALLSGFLIGDVRRLPAGDVEALRAAGLSHFVAVSGSNVALFLAGWWLAAGPLAWRPRRRALLGLAGLAVFVVLTRWEPSVVRAATMAALVLGGRLAGVPVDVWTALGGAVMLNLAISPELAGEVGFQLSVAATAGVLIGGGLGARRRPRWLWTAAGVTTGAQAAVAPLLLLHFGTVPLLSPVVNLVAAPVVGAATVAGGVGVATGLGPITAVAVAAARVVLAVARTAAGWPQAGWVAVAALLALAAVAGLRPRLRPPAAVVAALALVAAVLAPAPPAAPTAVFLDVGQGDAVLLRHPSGAAVLVDGGPDPTVLLRALRRHQVTRLDLVVATHGDLDHVGGLGAVLESMPVGRLWHGGGAESGSTHADLLERAEALRVPTEAVVPGWAADVGGLRLVVHGPQRRYAADNDQSVVMVVDAGGPRLLLAGDAEVRAQAELGPISADILLVPHHGAGTSDPGWLIATGAAMAVISVGPNRFGHPHPATLAVLADMGAEVRRTDSEGDVEVSLAPLVTSPP